MVDLSALRAVIAAIALTGCLALPHGERRKCFTDFDNFEECWEDIEEYCLNDQGEFERCHPEPREQEVTSYRLSKHCYAS